MTTRKLKALKNCKGFNFFSNIIKNLKIPEYSNTDWLSEHIRHPVLKVHSRGWDNF